jgi:TetR/AcrR family transcriptional regulator, ethionamide resistance regulator
LEATSGLLESTSLAELSVAQILTAAAVGRTSFYEHFASKDDVVVKLLRRFGAEVGEQMEPMFERGEGPVDDAFREGLTNLIQTSSRHAALLVAVAEEWPAIPELRAVWFEMLGNLTGRLARAIEHDRDAGIAPPGAGADALAASLVWTAERAFHVAMIGVHLFVGTIYGRAARPPAAADECAQR